MEQSIKAKIDDIIFRPHYQVSQRKKTHS